ncbi:uncharacterized protein LOC143269551 [Peromyscus maniculatus bairdii]|uniref:uncharacterized protein LOC143269551 n=1 Tax=Peromyscus maniculatus bairdii TaxID=230844 RepID=UPI003FD38E32
MRPTQPPASRCGRPRGWARATKGAGGAGDCAKSPLGSRTRCARIPGRCDRIPSRGLGTPSHEVRPRAGLGWRSRKAAPYPAGPLPGGRNAGAPRRPGARIRPLAALGHSGRGRFRGGIELSTAALGAARGHARIWHRAGDPGGKRPWGGIGADDGTQPS